MSVLVRVYPVGVESLETKRLGGGAPFGGSEGAELWLT
jgi:hypothetical protein